jgi:hypothetical protein
MRIVIAIISEAGIRLKGVGNFQGSSPHGTLEKILDKLNVRTENGKRLQMDSIDDAVVRPSVPMEEAIKILEASGVEIQISGAA